MLGIATVTDGVVLAALELALEPVFEADFKPVSYGLRSSLLTLDAVAGINFSGTRGQRWVADAYIQRVPTRSTTRPSATHSTSLTSTSAETIDSAACSTSTDAQPDLPRRHYRLAQSGARLYFFRLGCC